MTHRPRSRRPTPQDLPWEEPPVSQSSHPYQNFETATSNTRWDGGQPITPESIPRQSKQSYDVSRRGHESLPSNPPVEHISQPFSLPDTPPASAKSIAAITPASSSNPSPPPTKPVQIRTASSRNRIPSGDDSREWVDRLGGTGLQDNKESRFLDAVDNIRKHALDCKLDIPELVVCGSQSSGKSSVLEAITRIPFPRGDTTCTRFVTQIRVLRADENYVSVTIIPDPHRSAQDQAILRQFSTTGGPSDMPSMVTDAGRAMGLRDGYDTWTNDILSVEIRGPTLQRLTLVDLPGLIDVDKQGRSGDSRLVESITDRYISKPQSIILAVVNADADVQKHRILEKAKKVDPTGKRTFGIITKPDRTEAGLGNEAEWFKLMDGKSDFFVFQKGWHVLVNRNGQETVDDTSPESRDNKEEAFFKEDKWKVGMAENVGKSNRWHTLYPTEFWGVKQLRPRLRTLLFAHTQEQIPYLKTSIKQKLAAYEDEIAAIDRTLLDKEELRGLLEDISSDMQVITDHGAKGTYREHDFFQIRDRDSGRYLRAKVRHEGEGFDNEMKNRGHRPDFAWGPEEEPPAGDEWISKVDSVLKRIKGSELPFYHDPHCFDLIFIHYSTPWFVIADDYVGKAYEHCRVFLREVIDASFERDLPNLSRGVWEHVFQDRLEKYKENAAEELRKLQSDRSGLVITENKRFINESSKKFSQRLTERVAASEARGETLPQGTPNTVASLGMETPEGLRRQQAMRFIDDMLTYYSIARDRFIDNVVTQVVERHLLAGLRKIFKLDWLRNEELFNKITHDPDHEKRRLDRVKLDSRRKNLRSCFNLLDDLARLS